MPLLCRKAKIGKRFSGHARSPVDGLCADVSAERQSVFCDRSPVETSALSDLLFFTRRKAALSVEYRQSESLCSNSANALTIEGHVLFNYQFSSQSHFMIHSTVHSPILPACYHKFNAYNHMYRHQDR